MGQVYLLFDINQKGIGLPCMDIWTITYLGMHYQDEMQHPHIATNLDNFKLVGRVPFYPNCMFVTTNNRTIGHIF